MINKEVVRLRRLIMVINKGIMTRQGIMAELDLSKDGIRNFRVNYLNPARSQGLVEMSRPGSPNSPDQAYKLTRKGLEVLDQLTNDSQSKTVK